MPNTHQRELQFHRTQNGREPFTEWFESIRDQKTRLRIQGRLDRLEVGNFGDCQSVGSGVFELRLHFGAAIEFISVKWLIQLCFYSVAVTSHHKHETLCAQKPIGKNIRRRIGQGTQT